MTDAVVITTVPTGTSGESALEKALESAGWVHPDAPEGFLTPGHKQAAAEAANSDPVDHLSAIAELATQAKTSSPAGVELISDQILAHVEAMRG